MLFFFYIFFVFLISFGFTLVIYLLGYSFLGGSFSKSSPFECGFSLFSNFSEFFSVPFFLVSLMFLLFDVEVILLCLFPLSFSFFFLSGASFFFVILIIFYSTLYEWASGILSWV